MEHGPLVAAIASFGIGLVASLTPCVYGEVKRTVATFGVTGETPLGRRAALSGTFLLGVAALFTPLGIFSALGWALVGWAVRTGTVGMIGIALVCAGLSASMFGAFALTAPAGLRRKLAALGGEGFRGAFAMGLVMGVLAAPTTLPFVVGLSALTGRTANGWLGGATLLSFALGLGAPFFFAGLSAVRLPRSGPWLAGSKWVSGVGLGYVALAHLHDHFSEIREAMRNPRFEPGIVAAAVLLVGVTFGVIHVLAERPGSALAHLSRSMRLASIVPAVFGCALFFSWLPHEHGNAPAITWLTDEGYGRAIARAESKPVIVVFNATWCCQEVEHDMFFDPRVREEAMRFTSIAVDASDEMPDTRRLQQKYKVVGLPAIIMFDAAGREVAQLNSVMPPLELLAAMKEVPSAHAGR